MKKQNRKSNLALAFVAGASLLLASPLVRAADKKEHAHDASSAAMPTTAAAALDRAQDLHKEIATLVKAKNLKPVHELAEKMTETLNMLPGLSKDLPADKKTRAEGTVKNLAKALDALHDAADENNQAGSEKQLAAVDSLMKLLAAQYPAKAAHAH
ncbi:MAG: hypothetical protein JNK23_12900 [Opitutaceae bacterium]|nr:hypothetical protein [Opitutaceae bacterium]